jgi:hypothetical protein
MDALGRDGGLGYVTLESTLLSLCGVIAAALLACEVSKRKIILLRVKLVWNLSIDPTVAVSYLNVVPFEDDRRSVTALEWIRPEGGQVRLSMMILLLRV